MVRDSGEMLAEDGGAGVVVLCLPDRSPTDSFETAIESSSSGAERPDGSEFTVSIHVTSVASRCTFASWMKRAARSFSSVLGQDASISSSSGVYHAE